MPLNFFNFKSNWKSLVPMLLYLARMIEQKLREQDVDTIGGDDEAAELIEHFCKRLENFVASQPPMKP